MGLFTPGMSFAMRTPPEPESLQSLMAEAFNDVLRKHSEAPVGINRRPTPP
ncbi:hypothetical protein [uncultured Sphingomonas sp.]|uniref:hypothetical protein n=1 Tax=uncultured Sphingomonas sp. TaxID=158754 RepID=UPI00344BC5CB